MGRKSKKVHMCICCCCCSVTQLCPTLCDLIDCSTPGFLSFTISQSLLKLMPIESIRPSNHFILCCPFSSCLQSFPAPGSFPTSQVFKSGDQSIGASASASVLPVNFKGLFPLRLTSLISFQSNGLSRVFSSTTFWKHQFFDTRSSL